MHSLPRAQAGQNQSTLFDNSDRRLEGYNAFSVAVGAFYQTLANQVLQGESLVTDRMVVLCPDLLLADGETVVEVKASSNKQPYRLRAGQLEDYRRLSEEGGFRVLYGFFEHGLRNGFKTLPKKTIRSAIEHLAERTRYLLVMDFSVVQCMTQCFAEREDKMYGLCVSVPHPAVRLMVTNPVLALDQLGLSLAEYLVVQSEVVDMRVAGVLVAPFPVVYIYRKERAVIVRRPVKLEMLTTPTLEPEVEEELPF